MAPTKPAGRGRGRPRKSDTNAADGKPVESKPTETKAVETKLSPADPSITPKRGRGRPPKDPSGVPQSKLAKPSTGRGRGRPPKDPSGVTQAKVTKPSTGRGRGRPPKDPNAPKTPAKPKSGRPRGRPPGSGKKQKEAIAAGAKPAAGSDRAHSKASKVVDEEKDLGQDFEMADGDDDDDADADADEDGDNDAMSEDGGSENNGAEHGFEPLGEVTTSSGDRSFFTMVGRKLGLR